MACVKSCYQIIMYDLPEASSYCLTYKRNMPCYSCIILQYELNNIDEKYSELILIWKRNIRRYYSIFPLKNIFWDNW